MKNTFEPVSYTHLENSLVEWAIEEDEDMDEEETDMLQEEQPKTAGRKADTRTLPELLIERHDILIERIGTRLKTHATETDIARLFIALVEYRFMRKCPIKTFRNAPVSYTHLDVYKRQGCTLFTNRNKKRFTF